MPRYSTQGRGIWDFDDRMTTGSGDVIFDNVVEDVGLGLCVKFSSLSLRSNNERTTDFGACSTKRKCVSENLSKL